MVFKYFGLIAGKNESFGHRWPIYEKCKIQIVLIQGALTFLGHHVAKFNLTRDYFNDSVCNMEK